MRLIRNKFFIGISKPLDLYHTYKKILSLLLYHENEYKTLQLNVLYVVLTIYTANSLLLAR